MPNAGINGTLHKLMEYFDGKRAYIFEFDFEREVSNNTYEVCAPGVESELEHLQAVPLSVMSFWLRAFDRQNYCLIEDVDSLDDSRAEEREILRAQGIRSLIAVPLKHNGELIGFFGVDDGRQQRALASDLFALADYITVMLQRRELKTRLVSANKTMAALMNGIPGGFVRLRQRDDGALSAVYINEGFCKLAAMEPQRLDQLCRQDIMALVHPDDLSTVRSAIALMQEHGKADSRCFRLLQGDGAYVRARFFGQMATDENKDTFINLFFTGVSS